MLSWKCVLALLVGCVVAEMPQPRWTAASRCRLGNTTTTTLRAGAAAAAAPSNNINATFSLFQPGDGSEENDGIPNRYMRMQKGNRKRARAALEATLAWRAQHHIDTILGRRPHNVSLFREIVPHAFLGRDALGHVVLCMRCGYVDTDLMERNGVTLQQLLMHYVFVLEYLWNVLEPAPDRVMTLILDLSGITMNKMRRFLGFVKQFSSTIDQHYPQRSYKTLVVNVPKWFGAIYRLISPLLRESTRHMIQLHSHGVSQTETLARYLGGNTPPPLDVRTNRPPTTPLQSHLQEAFEQFCLMA